MGLQRRKIRGDLTNKISNNISNNISNKIKGENLANRHKKLVNRNLSYHNKGEQSHSFMKSSSMMGEANFSTISNNRSLVNKTALQKLGTLNGE